MSPVGEASVPGSVADWHLVVSEVDGYHGTSSSPASVILRDGFQPSSNNYDWLGDGVYFFQDAPHRAWEWARQKHGTDAAVVGARIKLEFCIDLLDIEWFQTLSAAYDGFLRKIQQTGLPFPRQTGGAHRLDREVLNYAIAVLKEQGYSIKSVRAAFAEGAPAFPNSALLNRSHVQIAVRDTSVIVKRWLESEPKP
jgi:hypothetical protein